MRNIPCQIFFPASLGFAYSPKCMTLLPSLSILSNSRMLMCGPIPTGTIFIPISFTFLISSLTRFLSCLEQILWSVSSTRTCKKWIKQTDSSCYGTKSTGLQLVHTLEFVTERNCATPILKVNVTSRSSLAECEQLKKVLGIPNYTG